MNRGRRVAWRGGRWQRDRASARGGVSETRLTLRRGWMRAAMRSALAYIARRQFQERKGRIWMWDSASAEKESDDSFDLRRKAALTCGSTALVTDRRSSARARASLRARRLVRLGPGGKQGRGERPRARGQAGTAGCGWAGREVLGCWAKLK
jgi:hypothetical protein